MKNTWMFVTKPDKKHPYGKTFKRRGDTMDEAFARLGLKKRDVDGILLKLDCGIWAHVRVDELKEVAKTKKS